MANILLLQRHSPFSSSHGREALDLALALAAVEHNVSILFSGDAVYQLLPTATHADFKLKAYPRSFALFELYGIDQLYVCQPSLQQRGISVDQLSLAVTALAPAAQAALIAEQHQVIGS